MQSRVTYFKNKSILMKEKNIETLTGSVKYILHFETLLNHEKKSFLLMSSKGLPRVPPPWTETLTVFTSSVSTIKL